MKNSRPRKEESGKASQVDCMGSTSARTRPFSYDEIMLRRKNRADAAKQIADGSGLPDIASAMDNIEKVLHSPKSRRKRNEDSATMDTRHTANDSQKVCSTRKKDINVSSKNNKLVQDNDKGFRPDAKSKGTLEPNLSSNKVTGGKTERRHHSDRIKDGLSIDNSDNGSDKRRARDLVKKDKVSERGRGKSDIDGKQLDDDRHEYKKRKTDKIMGSDTENESNKKNMKDVMRTEKLSDRGGEKSEKENKHKFHNEEYKTRGRGSDKKHGSEKRLDYTQTYHEESRPKRRRSRSKEHERNRSRRSPSHSPKLHKDIFKDKNEHGELSSHSTKDRSGREHSEVDKKRIPSSGSNSNYRRSKEHERERSRRSPSHSPKLHKDTFNGKCEHGELSSHSTKDRSGKEHSEVDKKRLPSNGSNSHYRRNTVSSSGLGGYSPRKRKTDAAAKTPSPIRRSPEGNDSRDLQPIGKESIIPGLTLSNSHSSQNLSSIMKEIPSGTPVTPTIVKPAKISHQNLSSQMHVIEPVQLTQATRPMRRLYVENLPASASEKDFMECVNKVLRSSGFNHIQGTQPCISCIIHKEKGQALLEFLTPEDASAALSLDGIFFSGCYLKFRRPKDYAEVTTGLLDKSAAAVDSIIGVVEDSSHKIFVGGISQVISSKMLLEIARAFGPVKAYHFQHISDCNKRCAFLEFADHSVTSKACAGLNGMRLGGQVVTAVCANPDPVSVGNVGKSPFYGIPEHAKPLLEKPTPVLKLKNVLDPEGLLSLSELELEEILEDIKLECSRFGMVKSVNIAKPTHAISTLEVYEANNRNGPSKGCNLEFDNKGSITEQLGENINELGEFGRLQPPETLDISENNCHSTEDNKGCNNSAEDFIKDAICKSPSNDTDVSVKDPSGHVISEGSNLELVNQQNTSANKLENNDYSSSISAKNSDIENKPLVDEELKLDENNSEIEGATDLENDERKELDALMEDDRNDNSADSGDVFEPGSVFVEYKRAEAACMAAHCLHGRIFDGRVVTVGYVGNDLYHMKFRR
ncbi:hypothetical protein ACJIZ3_017072 [Penstemon smallii]|uniref:RRM domain-containing protein n=1 Tax=Penstemon smallii TaxID=265156 RepID=A0ABD3SUX9_9LAMI